MGLISRVSSRTYRYLFFKFENIKKNKKWFVSKTLIKVNLSQLSLLSWKNLEKLPSQNGATTPKPLQSDKWAQQTTTGSTLEWLLLPDNYTAKVLSELELYLKFTVHPKTEVSAHLTTEKPMATS